jgi:hypothetical protein
MKSLLTIILIVFFIATAFSSEAQEVPFWNAKIPVTSELQKPFTKGGRLLLLNNTSGVEPINLKLPESEEKGIMKCSSHHF